MDGSDHDNLPRRRTQHQQQRSGTCEKEPKADENSQQLAGLCVNCDSRHSCTRDRPESGVWHCQDYR